MLVRQEVFKMAMETDAEKKSKLSEVLKGGSTPPEVNQIIPI